MCRGRSTLPQTCYWDRQEPTKENRTIQTLYSSLTIHHNSRNPRWNVEGKGKGNTAKTEGRNGTLVRHSQSPQITWRIHKRMETSSTIQFSIKMRTDGTVSQLTYCRSSWKRQYARISLPALLVAWDDYLGGTICSRMCTLPTEQDTYHQEEDSPLLHPRRPIDAPVQHCCPRSHHSATTGQWIWHNSHHSRPGMLQSCHLSPMPHKHHWRGSGPLIPQTSVSMVWSSLESDIQLRPLIHIPLCASLDDKAKHRAKY